MKFDTTGLESYITDPKLESETGVWLQFPEGREFLVLRAGGSNKAFTRRFQQLIKPHRRRMERGTLDNDISEEIMRRAFVEQVVIDWRGIKDEDGVTVPWSQEAGYEFFKAFPELFGEITALAFDLGTFSEQNVQEAEEVLGEL